MPDNFAVVYCKVVEEKKVKIKDDDGNVIEERREPMKITYPFLAGITETEPEANKIAKKVNNDKSIQAIVIPRVFERQEGESLKDIIDRAEKVFKNMADDMYENERIIDRKKRR
jgi:uncharacterized circularly permuted ATP-grasp superfamily protein